MKEIFHIGIFSGKGGVGKTTICASLAVLLAKAKIQMMAVDTDVDAPNLSILFNSKNQKKQELLVQTTEKAELREEKCVHCQLCIKDQYCNFEALSWDEHKRIPIIDAVACEGCHACELLCSAKAFNISPINSGKIFTITSEFGFHVITGETILGAQTSGKLVTELKKFAEVQAKSQNCELVIYDGPPGIGCPVIASASGLDFIFIVIEPTQASLHDAERFLMIPQKFQIPVGIIINKKEISKDGVQMIRKFADDNQLLFIGEIPLDKDWPYSVSKRQPFVIYRPQSPTSQVLGNITDMILQLFRKYQSS